MTERTPPALSSQANGVVLAPRIQTHPLDGVPGVVQLFSPDWWWAEDAYREPHTALHDAANEESTRELRRLMRARFVGGSAALSRLEPRCWSPGLFRGA